MHFQRLRVLYYSLFLFIKPVFCQDNPYFPASLGSQWVYQVEVINSLLQGKEEATVTISKIIDSITFERNIQYKYVSGHISGLDSTTTLKTIDTCKVSGLLNCTSEHYPNPDSINSSTPFLGKQSFIAPFTYNGNEFIELINSSSMYSNESGILKIFEKDIGPIYVKTYSVGSSGSGISNIWMLTKKDSRVIDTSETAEILKTGMALDVVYKKGKHRLSQGINGKTSIIWDLRGRRVQLNKLMNLKRQTTIYIRP